jgi:hypothetical protein
VAFYSRSLVHGGHGVGRRCTRSGA